jgi:hypothetical protein
MSISAGERLPQCHSEAVRIALHAELPAEETAVVVPLGAQQLVPGSARGVSFRIDPPSAVFYGLADGLPPEQTVFLPEGTQIHSHLPVRPVWESPHRLLVVVSGASGPLGSLLLRYDLGTGAFERVPTGDHRHVRAVVTPLIPRDGSTAPA